MNLVHLVHLVKRILRHPAARRCFAGLVSLIALWLTSSMALAAPQADGDQPIDLSLREASLPDVLESFARIAGGELDISPEIGGDVTVDLKSVPWKRALHQVCRTHGLSCFWMESDEPKLVVRSSDGFRGMAESIDMALRQAPLQVVLQAMDSIAGDEFQVEVDTRIESLVDIQISSTPWPEALEHVCKTGRCRLTWRPDGVLVEPPGDAPPAESEASSGTETPERSLLVESPDLEHRIVELLDRADRTGGALPYAELDELCAAAGCEWTVRWGEPERFEVRPAESEPVPEASEPARISQSPTSTFGADPFRLRLFLQAQGPGFAESDVRLTWGRPSHRLGLARPGGSAWFFVTWIPFSSKSQTLLPYTAICGAGLALRAASPFTVFDTLRLPIEGRWNRRINHQTPDELRVAARSVDLDDQSLEPVEPPARTPASCADVAMPTFELTLTADDSEPTTSRFQPGAGSYFLVTPPSVAGERAKPAAAVVYLGARPDGGMELALLRPEIPVFPRSSPPASVERFVLYRGESWASRVGSPVPSAPAGRLHLRITHTP